MLTPQLADKIGNLYLAGCPSDLNNQLCQIVTESPNMQEVLATFTAACGLAIEMKHAKLALAAAICMVEMGYRLRVTEELEEMASK